MVGIGGGALVGKYQLDVSFSTFFDGAFRTLRVKDVLFGLLKSYVFGIVVTMVACQQGMATTGGAEGVGRATMRSVVYSFLMILVANYLLFSLIYRPFFGD
jgi:phospholipid/cholesterol/gamma-HCH transport system permease protein